MPVFDDVASLYDRSFSQTLLGRWLRGAVWERLGSRFRPGMHVLELGCGTGEDAIWLARHGIRVTASDVSPAMLDVGRGKAAAAGVSDLLDFGIIDLASLPPAPGAVDGAFSDFGAVNCIAGYADLASWLAGCVRPGGYLILVAMGPTCLWEIAWHLLHLDVATALRRRQRSGVDARVAGRAVHIWYPAARQIEQAFAPWFRLKTVRGIGVFLPPLYLAAGVERRPRFFSLLHRLDAHLAGAWPLRELGDHYLIEMERRPS